VIFLTGGTGFLGRHLVAGLCRQGYAIRLLTRQPAAYPWLKRYPHVDIITGDLTRPDSFAAALDGCRYVIHAGGMFRFWGDSHAFQDTNTRGTEHLLAAADRRPIERFIHVSTVAVVGQPDPAAIIDETVEPRPMDPYQQSKLRGEQIAQRYAHERNVPVIVLRPGAYYGPLGHYGFNRLFFEDPMRGIIMQVDGGRYIIFPVYIGDVVQGILRALDHGRVSEVYNICGDWISHREAFDIVCAEAGLRWPRLPVPGPVGISMSHLLEWGAVLSGREPFWPINLRSYVYNNWRVSSEKARQELGFSPLDFREGARRTSAWYRAGQPDDWPELDC
jgi:dihydroflavonol-4-reductase